MRRLLFPTMLLAGLSLAIAGCKKKVPTAGMPGGFAVQVVAVEAKRQPVTETLSLVGTLAANEMVEIKSDTDGMVEEINFKEGQRVPQGHLLFKLDESKLAASVAEAQANFKLKQADFERSRELYNSKLISPQDFDQIASQFHAAEATLELKRRQMKDARIHAAFDGIMGARQVSPGQVIARNTTLSWLVDLDPVKAELNVPERFLSEVRVGQTIELSVAAYPDQKFQGEVYFVSPHVDPAWRTVLVKAYVKNSEQRLRPGMFANLDLTLKVRDQAVLVPEAAVMISSDKASLYTIDGGNTAQLKAVTTGLRMAGKVEITSGLQGGELVIVEGTQKVVPGGKVKLAPPEAAQPYLDPERTNGLKAGS
ncbi:MAG: efflux RND transporter periplasmic adaptor subunit [Verrucomicrobia subdivision 3 bacterium]|nr:efflux RND transporter periplasmic adaptor subunit [Limisphaerales bacterium]